MIVQPVVNNAAFPFSATFTSNGGKLLVEFAGSAWRSSGGKVSVNLLMDGNVIATASVLTNEPNSHKALVPVAVLVSAAAGSHTLTVKPSSGATNVDSNDFFTVTVTESAPNYFENGTHSAGYLVTPGWQLHTPAAGADRQWRETITFSKPFNEPPKVTAAFSMLDADKNENLRVRLEVDNITDTSFELVYSTWGGTTVYSVTASWFAFGDAE